MHSFDFANRKVIKFQWRRCHQKSSKSPITKSDDIGIRKEFQSEYWRETLVANTSDDFGILQ